jgi:hypothetical protein
MNVKILVDGIIEIRKATRAKKKYDHLLSKLKEIGWVNKNKEIWENVIKHDYTIKIVYIQPTTRNDDVDKTIITFDDVKTYLTNKENVLAQRFIKSLETWI